MIKQTWLVIMVILTLVVGLALIGPAYSLVRGAQDDMNCSTADSYTKLTCTITNMSIWYFALAMLMFIGVIYFVNKRQDSQYSDPYAYPSY